MEEQWLVESGDNELLPETATELPEKLAAINGEELLPIDVELVKQAAAGDHDAFTKLFYQTYRYTFVLIAAVLRADEDIRDALQDTYTKVYTGLPRLREPEAFLGWLKVIARNCAASIRRKNENDPLHYRADGEEELFLAEEMQHETAMDIRAVLGELPEEQARLLVLVYYDGMKLSEIARMQGVAPSTVRSRFHAAKKALIAALSGRGIDRSMYGRGGFLSAVATALRDAIGTDVLSAAVAQDVLDAVLKDSKAAPIGYVAAKLSKRRRDAAVLRIAALVVALSLAASALMVALLLNKDRLPASEPSATPTTTTTTVLGGVAAPTSTGEIPPVSTTPHATSSSALQDVPNDTTQGVPPTTLGTFPSPTLSRPNDWMENFIGPLLPTSGIMMPTTTTTVFEFGKTTPKWPGTTQATIPQIGESRTTRRTVATTKTNTTAKTNTTVKTTAATTVTTATTATTTTKTTAKTTSTTTTKKTTTTTTTTIPTTPTTAPIVIPEVFVPDYRPGQANTVGNVAKNLSSCDGYIAKQDNWLYRREGYTIIKQHLETGQMLPIYRSTTYLSHFNVVGDWLYFLEDHNIMRMHTDGSDVEKLGTSYRWLAVRGQELFYLKHDDSGYSLCRMDVSTRSVSTIGRGMWGPALVEEHGVYYAVSIFDDNLKQISTIYKWTPSGTITVGTGYIWTSSANALYYENGDQVIAYDRNGRASTVYTRNPNALPSDPTSFFPTTCWATDDFLIGVDTSLDMYMVRLSDGKVSFLPNMRERAYIEFTYLALVGDYLYWPGYRCKWNGNGFGSTEVLPYLL